jgi:hypothetical protein
MKVAVLPRATVLGVGHGARDGVLEEHLEDPGR